MFSEMTSRERILAAIRHEELDRVPMDYWGTAEATDKIMKGIGAKTEDDFIRILHLDKIRSVSPRYVGPKLHEEGLMKADIWGVVRKTIPYKDNAGTYDEIVRHPLQQFESIDEIEAGYKWPTADLYDFSDIAALCDRYEGYAIEGGYMAPFYYYNNIRGLQDSLIDLAADPELADYIIDKICAFFTEYHTRLFEAANGKIHLAQVTDDFGAQSGLMISLDMYRRFFKDRAKKNIRLVKSYGIHVFHHDDGSIMPLIPDLCEDGIEILNPIQWHLPGMDLTEMKDRFGDRICFHGGIDNQFVLPFGTTSDVEAEVRTCIEILARDKTGYIMAPCHNVQAISSVENVVTMYEAGRKYGSFIAGR
jgi:uroporphyrinogen decarboxylase